ncbi:BTB/POZ domain-containing protein 8 isoform X2 [Spea bombifrons]|uniref:BTB/POZ domain-containing protein 8 isoform X2 n=1 Tax=Spea bombifrons TaxID=233779 RepID=UPI002349CE8B|nr:BTB/POZ domain-containing protein 8 isoform X2 [Spea bombifrons]
MAAGGRAAPADMTAVYAKEVAERRRLQDMLCDQLGRDLLRLLNEEIHTDIVLCVDKSKFKAHKAVLRARTPRFYRYITRHSSAEKNTLANVEASEIQAFLKIVYSSHYKVKETEESILGSIDNEWLKSTQEHNDDLKSSIHDENLSAVDKDGKRLLSIKDVEKCPVESGNKTETQDHFELEAASELGNDLLCLFLHSWCSDITIQTEDKQFLAHRAILCARSSYFAAMLSGCWAESSQDLIQIRGICSVDMTVMMHFIYGAILDLPKNVEPGHILSIADMYGLEGLKEVAIYVLKRDYCKFFHKPVVGMQPSVLECLSIAHSLGEEQLYNSCMRWVEKYFVKCWSEKSFASLPFDLQRQCLTALVQSLSYRNAAFLLMESDRLSSSLPGVKWAQRAKDLASELQEECVRFMVTNFSQIIKSQSFSQLLQAQGMSSTPYLLEQVFNEVEKSISFQNSCSLFMALDELLNLASQNEMGFTCKIQAVRDKLWTFLLQSFYAVRHTEGWKLMRASNQQKIQAAAVDKGDDRRLTKKPVLTSSQSRSRILEIKESSQTVESKRHSEGSLFYPRKMKSDSLGASGHTSNGNRNSSGKGKEDDVKGKDGKKPITKGTKDPKPAEKIVATKPKIVSKPKPESNGSAKTESCNAKGDTTGAQKTALSQRLGARPKVVNGGINSQAKVKSVKKTNKELSSPVKCTNGKSVLSNGEHPLSNKSPGEANHDRTSDECRQPANCSPQGGKKCVLDASKDLGMTARWKSPAKLTNGASVKRKVNNEAECHRDTTSPSAKKAPLNGDSETVLQKKKTIKTSNCAIQQRAKSAPAALSKKQGVQGDGTTLVKSVSSKQPEVKSDTKLISQSTSTEKNGPTNKKNTKPPLVSESKISAQKGTPSKQGLSGNKGSTTNNKRPKQKAVIGSQSSKASNHPQEQKGSAAELENSHGQETLYLEQGTDKAGGCGDTENDCKRAALCPSGHSEHQCSYHPDLNEHESNRESSIQKQNSNTQESDLDHRSCQKNTLVVAELNPKDSIDLITPVDEQLFLNKPEGKICDSENSKCADSSSESELCSVKEVEKNPRPNGNRSTSETFLELPQNISSVLHDSKRTAHPFSDGIPTIHQSALRGSEHFMNLASERQIMECPRDGTITKVIERHENSEIQFMDHWNKHSSALLERESPESESGSASTSSDDIKPRSEDYDAGGSQDDDGSNDRGISKCSTMRCHDFLGRSSSDTSTPEELKGYDGNLRIDVKVKKENSELFRVNSTSDDEVPRKRPDMWLQRDGPKHSSNPKALCSSMQFPQEIEHLSSSADETEDERSEAENSAEKAPSGVSSQPFQGIVNLAFDDVAEFDSEGQLVSGNKNFTRSVLLSVDECEELGSDEGEPHSSQMHKAESLTPADVFEKITNEHSDGDDKQALNKNTKSSDVEAHSEKCIDGMALVTEVLPAKEQTPTDVAQSDIHKGFFKHPESEFKSQTRPCRLDLYTADPPDTQRFCPNKTQNACKSDNLVYQGKDNHESPTENSNTALPEGHIDDFDSLAHTCIYEHRPSKSLSPIYEMDPGDGNEQRMKTETKIMDFGFEDQHFVEGDWTLLRQLLAEHGSDVDIINSVPEDLSLAQYLINQTLLLARENSKSQGKAQVDTSSKWGDLTSPFDDSTSATMTSFSPEDSSPHGEWTILELETHH